jgi:hypothetical protein
MTPRQFLRALAKQHPPFLKAVIADARCASANLGRPLQNASRYETVRETVRLAFQTDAFVALVLYRGKARLRSLGVPILPRVAHRLAMIMAQVSIGDPVVIEAGIYLPHGQIVIDGLVTIGAGTTIRPGSQSGSRTATSKAQRSGGGFESARLQRSSAPSRSETARPSGRMRSCCTMCRRGRPRSGTRDGARHGSAGHGPVTWGHGVAVLRTGRGGSWTAGVVYGAEPGAMLLRARARPSRRSRR